LLEELRAQPETPLGKNLLTLPNRRIGKNRISSNSIPTSSSYYRGKPLSLSFGMEGTGMQ
jgi:hypothetical protein